MKSLLVAAFVSCMSLAASASLINKDSSWAEINASYRHLVKTPADLSMLNAVGGIFNACVDGNRVRSIKAVKYCASGHQEQVGQGETYGGFTYVCDAYAKTAMSLARNNSAAPSGENRKIPTAMSGTAPSPRRFPSEFLARSL